MKPHKHAELIKAWADGAEIEVRVLNTNRGWSDWQDDPNPCWVTSGRIYYEYRIKPEPKPDVVKYLYFKITGDWGEADAPFKTAPTIKVILDPYTRSPKSAEVIG